MNLLFVGYGFSKQGPYLIFDDLEKDIRKALLICNRTMTIEMHNERRCIGTYDLTSFLTAPCQQHAVLDEKHRGNYCDICKHQIGFNPAFYNAKKISPQQMQYNNQPHVVYMAYFSKHHVKVGIASKKRHATRLLEQGARAAVILNEYSNAQEARQLEAALCANDMIYEQLSSELKLGLLINGKYSYDQAVSTLELFIHNFYKSTPIGSTINYNEYYFPSGNSNVALQRMENHRMIQISGNILGMIGDLIIVRQASGINYAVSVKKYISHVVSLYLNEEKYSYVPEPKQLSLFD